MLVLSRKRDEFIQIGPDIQVHIVDLGRGRVRIGVRAPRDLVILRGPEHVTQEGVVLPHPSEAQGFHPPSPDGGRDQVP